MKMFLVLEFDDEYGYKLFEACCISAEVAQEWIDKADHPHYSYFIEEVEVFE